VHVYVRVAGTWSRAMIDGPKIRGCYEFGDYRHVPTMPEEEAELRDNDRWARVGRAQGAEELGTGDDGLRLDAARRGSLRACRSSPPRSPDSCSRPPQQRTVLVKNVGANPVEVSKDPAIVFGTADNFNLAANAEERIELEPGDSLFGRCGAALQSQVDVI
jgi:hypothetical protein